MSPGTDSSKRLSQETLHEEQPTKNLHLLLAFLSPYNFAHCNGYLLLIKGPPLIFMYALQTKKVPPSHSQPSCVVINGSRCIQAFCIFKRSYALLSNSMPPSSLLRIVNLLFPFSFVKKYMRKIRTRLENS